MARAKRLLKESLNQVDLVLEIRDARVPLSSANPDFEDLFLNKKRIIIMNKKDLADDSLNKLWVDFFREQSIESLLVNSLDNSSCSQVRRSIYSITEDLHEEYFKRRGMKKTIRGMVTGIPNVGKSAFINGLTKTNKAKTGNRPGVTKINQWIRVNTYFELMDTPGILWPKLDQDKTAYNLAFTGTIKEEILDLEDVVHNLLENIKVTLSDQIIERYGQVNLGKKGYEILEEISLNKGWIKAGGLADTLRGSKHVLDDFQQGRLGLITLEKPF